HPVRGATHEREFYAVQALFDRGVVRKVVRAAPADLVAAGQALDATAKRRAAVEGPLNELIAPYKRKLYDDRVAMLPADVQTIIRKPEKERTAAEQKIADDYYPILRIDSDKIAEVMPAEERRKYQELQRQLNQVGTGGGRRG